MRNGKITENSLPYSVRTHVEKATLAHRNRQFRNSMIKTQHETNADGSFVVKLALSDGVGEVVSMEMFAASEQQALELESGFRKNAESVYNKLVEMILG